MDPGRSHTGHSNAIYSVLILLSLSLAKLYIKPMRGMMCGLCAEIHAAKMSRGHAAKTSSAKMSALYECRRAQARVDAAKGGSRKALRELDRTSSSSGLRQVVFVVVFVVVKLSSRRRRQVVDVKSSSSNRVFQGSRQIKRPSPTRNTAFLGPPPVHSCLCLWRTAREQSMFSSGPFSILRTFRP